VRYFVRAEHVMAAFARARSLPYVSDVTIFGRDLHLVVSTDIDEKRLRTDLADCGVSIIERIEPSLEDVFVALTRARTAAA
jgi:hypothetical protein